MVSNGLSSRVLPWVVANTRIFHHLLFANKLPTSRDLRDYLAYTVKIMELGANMNIVSCGPLTASLGVMTPTTCTRSLSYLWPDLSPPFHSSHLSMLCPHNIHLLHSLLMVGSYVVILIRKDVNCRIVRMLMYVAKNSRAKFVVGLTLQLNTPPCWAPLSDFRLGSPP